VAPIGEMAVPYLLVHSPSLEKKPQSNSRSEATLALYLSPKSARTSPRSPEASSVTYHFTSRGSTIRATAIPTCESRGGLGCRRPPSLRRVGSSSTHRPLRRGRGFAA